MAYFAVEYTYSDDTGARDAHRPRHRAYLSQLAADGTVLASGPYLDTVPDRALLLIRAQDRTAVADLLAADPFQQEGLVTRTAVVEWNPVIGVFAEPPG